LALAGSSIGYGIIGCGMMGQEHIRNIALLDDAHVAAIFEPDKKMLAAALKLAPGAIPAQSIKELLALASV
jgi:myo-inositol 2-dehydrogenase/D-chiro-inositol 1-dehydrogenase